MKSIARTYMWWPGLDKNNEHLVKFCSQCAAHQSLPSVAPLHPWLWPSQLWQQIHADYARPFQGRMLLMLVDTHLRCLSCSWHHYMLPFECWNNCLLATDYLNSWSLIAAFSFHQLKLAPFSKKNGVKHLKSAPYHTSTNGTAEWFVQTLRNALRCGGNQDLYQWLMSFLLTYCTTTHATTNTAPCERFMGSHLRTWLDLLWPNLDKTVLFKQVQQK